MINRKFYYLIPCLLILNSTIASAQGAAAGSNNMLYAVVVLMAAVIFFQAIIVRRFVKLIIELQYKLKHGKDMPLETYLEAIHEKPGASKGIFAALTRSVPVGAEKDVMLDHNYDGIRELDNRMPPWLQYIFFGTIFFAIIYFLFYQIYDIGKNPTQEYLAELKTAEILKTERLKSSAASVDETSVVLLTDEANLATGKSIFIAKCVACHGSNGEGNVGPNLTDDYWIHGGTINDMFKVVKYGVPAKGMVPWQGILKPEEMQATVSYISTLHGTNPANAKAAQGVLFTAGASAGDSTSLKSDTSKLKI